MSHVTMRELHERRLASMSRDERKAFDLAYRREKLAAQTEASSTIEVVAGRAAFSCAGEDCPNPPTRPG